MDCLQDELLVSILDAAVIGHLIGNCSLVCKRWYRLCMEELPTLLINCDTVAARTGEEALDSVVCGIVSKRRNVLRSLDIFMNHNCLQEGALESIVASVRATIESITMSELEELPQPLVNALLECKGLRDLSLVYDDVEDELEVSGTWPHLNYLQMIYRGEQSPLHNVHVEKMVEACPALVKLELYEFDGPVSLRIRSPSLQKLLFHARDDVRIKMEAGNLQHLKLAGGATVELSGVLGLETLRMRCDTVLKPSKLLQNVSCLRLVGVRHGDARLDELIDNLKNVPIRKLIVLENVDLTKVVPVLAHCKEVECCASQADFQGLLASFGEKFPALAIVRLPSKEVLHLKLQR